MKYTIQLWEDIYGDTYHLYEKISSSNFKPDIIVGIARGGWVPTRLLADFFHLKQTANIKVEAYQMIGQEDVDPVVTQEIQIDINNKNILIVDDVVDSGATITKVVDIVKTKNPSSLKTAVLYYKPHSKYKPNFYTHETEAWVIFSWSYFESMRELKIKWMNEGLTKSQTVEKFKQIGIPPQIVNNYFNN